MDRAGIRRLNVPSHAQGGACPLITVQAIDADFPGGAQAPKAKLARRQCGKTRRSAQKSIRGAQSPGA
jgi:hypothetical protein